MIYGHYSMIGQSLHSIHAVGITKLLRKSKLVTVFIVKIEFSHTWVDWKLVHTQFPQTDLLMLLAWPIQSLFQVQSENIAANKTKSNHITINILWKLSALTFN